VSDSAIRLRERARLFGVTLPPDTEVRLAAYFDLLFRWNAKINLTALTDRDAAVDRLLLEPLAAASALPVHADLIDLGSGGGSPAIPLAIALATRRLVMIESRGRKAAFLAEAVRVLELDAVVESGRFEAVAKRGVYEGQMSLASIRAVRVDPEALAIASTFLKPNGWIALFGPSAASPPDFGPALRVTDTKSLPGGSQLVLLARCST
jgi:16S rRNA (guanine527-N7)-methyltransferase